MTAPAATGAGGFSGTARFELLESLGQGSMSLVYRVRDRSHGDVVALKTLKHLDSTSLYRLKQEFRALSHFDHPNLVSFYELLRDVDGWFVTMELVEGVDFLTWVRGEEAGRRSRQRTESTWRSAHDGRFSRSAPAGRAASPESATTEFDPHPDGTLPDLLRLRAALRQTAEGVAALHAVGRIHRDLKPSNVLVTDAGRVVILDFGLVAEIDQDYTEGTLQQNIAGSAAYMSPEQSIGLPLTEAADWYAVGVMLYEALTGVWPFSGHLYAILEAKNSRDPTPPSTFVPAVPEDLDRLCMDLLARDPEARPSGAEVLARLRAGHPLSPARLQPGLHGRDRELALLEQAVAESRSGRTVVVWSHGDDGIGKTRLLREWVKRLNQDEAGVICLKSRCTSWELLPYRALDGVVDNAVRVLRRADHTLLRQLYNEDLSWLAAWFPVLTRADALDVLPADGDGLSPGELAVRGLPQLATVLQTLASSTTLVLQIDDVHLGDTESAEVIGRLLQGWPEGLPLLVVLMGAEGGGGPFGRWLRPMLRDRSIVQHALELRPLEPRVAAALAADWLGRAPDDDEVQRLAAESGGVPGLLIHGVRAVGVADLRDSGTLTDVVRAEVEQLSASSLGLLELLAVAGGPVSTAVGIDAAALGEGAFAAISTLRAHRLAEVTGRDGDRLEVPSRPVADHVLERLGAERRAEVHLALARSLERFGEGEPAALVAHYAAGGAGDRAGVVAWTEATRALDEGRWAAAATLLELGLEVGAWSPRERGAVLGHLGRSLALLGRGPEAARSYEAAAELLPPQAERLRQLAAAQWLASGHLATGLAALDTLQRDAGLERIPGWLLGTATAWRRWRLWRRGTAWQEAGVRDLDPADLHRVDVAFTGACALSLTYPDRAATLQPGHVHAALDLGDRERLVRALAWDASLRASSRPTEALERLADLEQECGGDEACVAFVAAASARVAFLLGRLDEAVRVAGEAEVLLQRTAAGTGWERLQVRLVALRARWLRGERDAVARQTSTLLTRAREADDRVGQLELLPLWAGTRLAEDPAGVAAAVGEAHGLGFGTDSRPGVLVVLAQAQVEAWRQRAEGALAALAPLGRPGARSGALADPWLAARHAFLWGAAAIGHAPREVDRAVAGLQWLASPWAETLAERLRSLADDPPRDALRVLLAGSG